MGIKAQMQVFESFLEEKDLFSDFQKFKETGILPEDKEAHAHVEYLMGVYMLFWLAGGEFPIPQDLGFKPTAKAIEGVKNAYVKCCKASAIPEIELSFSLLGKLSCG